MRQSGFTLVELLLVTVLVAMIAIYAGQALSANERAYQAVDQTAESQQHLRALLDLVERDIRHAGMLMPESASGCGIDSTSAPDTLYLADGSAIDPLDDTSEYSGASITAGGVGAGTVTLTLNSLIIETSPPVRGAYDIDGNGVNDSDFRDEGGVIIYQPSAPQLGTTCGHITNVNVGASQITVVLKGAINGGSRTLRGGTRQRVPDRGWGPPVEWHRAGRQHRGLPGGLDLRHGRRPHRRRRRDLRGERRHRLRVDGRDSGHHPRGSRRPARGAGVDRGAHAARDGEFTRGRPQAMENRNGGAFVNDGFRRRVMMSQIRLRNVGTRFAAS